MDFLNDEYRIILGLIAAFAITYTAIPSIVRVAYLKSLTAEPDDRKIHSESIPTLGGVAIFAGITIASLFFIKVQAFPQITYIIVSVVILFFVGIKNDILVIAPITKLIGQLMAGAVITIFTDIRLSNLHGFFGIHDIPEFTAITLTIFVIVVIINAFNLIDGIDGLSAGIGIISSSIYGVWFFLTGHGSEAILSFSLIGALLAFLRFNLFSKHEKIFMGDTGALILGFFVAVFTIRFNEYNIKPNFVYAKWGAPAVSLALLVIPLFDTLRVMFIRFIIRRPLFLPDKRHIHHLFIRAGLNTKQTLVIMLAINILFASVLFMYHNKTGIRTWFLIIFLAAMIIFYIPVAIIRIRERKLKKNK